MLPKNSTQWFLLLSLLAALLIPVTSGQAFQPARPVLATDVTAFDLIIAMNTLRMSNGLPALVEDPIIDAVAQSTAEIMAANQMSWHIGDVGGRLAAAGYGGGVKVWATENFAVGNQSIDEIMIVWSDASHMIPAVNAAYCHIGAGVAKASNDQTYYVLQAAYIAGQSCGEYSSSGGTGTGSTGGISGVSQVIVPVKVATPDADGKIFHVVEAGQSFWAIAITYKITIKDLEIWNNITRDSKLQIGQRLFIPGSNTEGYYTPTPVGMVLISTPDSGGRIVHTVQSYQTLFTISQAYGVSVNTLLTLNGLQEDWPLQIGQELIIQYGSTTPNPLSALAQLTPHSDGRYYHTVKSGETLFWIAQHYHVTVDELMAWNGLDSASILYPEQELLLQMTLPATETPTPEPVTATPLPSTPTSTPTPVLTPPSPTAPVASSLAGGINPAVLFISVALAAISLFLIALFIRKKE